MDPRFAWFTQFLFGKSYNKDLQSISAADRWNSWRPARSKRRRSGVKNSGQVALGSIECLVILYIAWGLEYSQVFFGMPMGYQWDLFGFTNQAENIWDSINILKFWWKIVISTGAASISYFVRSGPAKKWSAQTWPWWNWGLGHG